MSFWEAILATAFVVVLVGGFVWNETIGKRRFMRRMWDYDRVEWQMFGFDPESFEKHRGPRP